MPAVTDPEAIRFVNEQVRPICELARALRARVTALETDWFAGMSTVIGSAAGDAIDDGREAEGVSRLTGADVTNAVANLIAARDALNVQVTSKPCVRPLSVG